jgi:phage anti-repressor protein
MIGFFFYLKIMELIKVATNAEGKQVVSARELHEFLEAKTDVGLWTKRMLDYGFEENVDYVTLKSENPINKQVTTQDYVLTLNCAKEISMIQRTDKGKQARQYFIACENKLKEIALASYQIEDPIERAKAWIKEHEEKRLLERKVENLSVAFNIESQWLSILKVSLHNKVNEKTFDWRLLKKESQRLGFEVKKMPSRRFEYQNIYHKDVFRGCYPQFDYNFE